MTVAVVAGLFTAAAVLFNGGSGDEAKMAAGQAMYDVASQMLQNVETVGIAAGSLNERVYGKSVANAVMGGRSSLAEAYRASQLQASTPSQGGTKEIKLTDNGDDFVTEEGF